jgi:predicted acetyltransferase
MARVRQRLAMTPDRPPLRLRPLREADEAEAVAAHEAMAGELVFLLGYDRAQVWDAYVANLERHRDGVDLPPRWVPSTYLVAEVGGQIVGRVSIRHEISNPFLATEGGHIGYGVLAEHRRRGYASEMLRQALGIVRDLGVERALVCCDDDNVGSAAVIERAGGEYESTVTGEGGQPVRRHWFALGRADETSTVTRR